MGKYPTGAIAHYQALVGESSTGTTTGDRMKELKDLRLVTVATENKRTAAPKKWRRDVPVTLTRHGQGGDRYITTTRGRVFICYAHGGKPSDLAARTKLGRLWAERKEDGQVVDLWPYQREDIVFELLGQLARRRCPLAPGWQARATLANGQRIDPDAIILEESLWGRYPGITWSSNSPTSATGPSYPGAPNTRVRSGGIHSRCWSSAPPTLRSVTGTERVGSLTDRRVCSRLPWPG